jgi:HEAT repeat protein
MRFPFSDPRQGEGDKVVVAKALGNIRDPRAVDALVQALCESSSDVCKAAAKSLAKLVNPNALEILIETLGDANKFRVVAAMQALADVHEPRTMEVIIDLLDDDDGDSYISGMAASALSEYLSDPRAEDASVRALGHRDRSVREKAAWGLKWQKASRQEGSEDPARADASEWNSLVEDVYTGGYAVYDLKDKHEYSEDDYIHRLTRFRDPRALEPLVRMLQYRHYYKSTAAVARALGERGDLRAVEPLLRALCPFGKRV